MSTAPDATPDATAPEKGSRALVVLFLIAFAVGLVVVAAHPGYRAAFLATLHGSGNSPIARSNAGYYGSL